MDLLNTNNTLSSKIHNIPKVVFKEGSLKITAGAMREIVDMLCIKDVDNVIEELGNIRTQSNLKTTLNMTLVDFADFDIKKLIKYFDKDYFFIKLSPINENEVSRENGMGKGIIKSTNIL